MVEGVFTTEYTENTEGFQQLEKCRTELPACPIEGEKLATAKDRKERKEQKGN